MAQKIPSSHHGIEIQGQPIKVAHDKVYNNKIKKKKSHLLTHTVYQKDSIIF